jgi:hypothetical protein
MSSTKVIPNMEEKFANMPCSEIIQHLSSLVVQLNDRRKEEGSFNLKEKRMMSEFENSALKLEQARRGL